MGLNHAQVLCTLNVVGIRSHWCVDNAAIQHTETLLHMLDISLNGGRGVGPNNVSHQVFGVMCG